jgi:pimeloyl-ACP methyl ester carboxylesterase
LLFALLSAVRVFFRSRTAIALISLLASRVLSAAEPLVLETPTGTLFGTLEVPAGKTAFPVVLIHAGSGPTDRDGNSTLLPGKNNSLKMLAEALAVDGIASLRYPANEIAKLNIPVLIIQGSTDMHVGVADAKLLAVARPSAKLVIIAGMNHVLKDVTADREKQLLSYSDSSLPIVPKLTAQIENFVRDLTE